MYYVVDWDRQIEMRKVDLGDEQLGMHNHRVVGLQGKIKLAGKLILITYLYDSAGVLMVKRDCCGRNDTSNRY